MATNNHCNERESKKANRSPRIWQSFCTSVGEGTVPMPLNTSLQDIYSLCNGNETGVDVGRGGDCFLLLLVFRQHFFFLILLLTPANLTSMVIDRSIKIHKQLDQKPQIRIRSQISMTTDQLRLNSRKYTVAVCQLL